MFSRIARQIFINWDIGRRKSFDVNGGDFAYFEILQPCRMPELVTLRTENLTQRATTNGPLPWWTVRRALPVAERRQNHFFFLGCCACLNSAYRVTSSR